MVDSPLARASQPPSAPSSLLSRLSPSEPPTRPASPVTQPQLNAAIDKIHATHYDKHRLNSSFVQRQHLGRELGSLAAKGDLDPFLDTLKHKIGSGVGKSDSIVEGSAEFNAGTDGSRKRQRLEVKETGPNPVAFQAAVSQFLGSDEGEAVIKAEVQETAKVTELVSVREEMVAVNLHLGRLDEAVDFLDSAKKSTTADGTRALRHAEGALDRLDQLESAVHHLPPPIEYDAICELVDRALEKYTRTSPLAEKVAEVGKQVADLDEARYALEKNLGRQERGLGQLRADMKASAEVAAASKDELCRSKVRAIEAKVGKIETAIEEAKADINTVEHKVKEVHGEVAQLDRNLAQAEEVVASLAEKQEDLEGTDKSLVDRCGVLEKWRDQVGRDLHKNEEDTSKYVSQLGAVEKAQTRLGHEHEQVRAAMNDLVASHAELRSARDVLQAQIDQSRDGRQEDQAQLAARLDRVETAASWNTIRSQAIGEIEAVVRLQMKPIADEVSKAQSQADARIEEIRSEWVSAVDKLRSSIAEQCRSVVQQAKDAPAEGDRCQQPGQRLFDLIQSRQLPLDLKSVTFDGPRTSPATPVPPNTAVTSPSTPSIATPLSGRRPSTGAVRTPPSSPTVSTKPPPDTLTILGRATGPFSKLPKSRVTGSPAGSPPSPRKRPLAIVEPAVAAGGVAEVAAGPSQLKARAAESVEGADEKAVMGYKSGELTMGEHGGQGTAVTVAGGMAADEGGNVVERGAEQEEREEREKLW